MRNVSCQLMQLNTWPTVCGGGTFKRWRIAGGSTSLGVSPGGLQPGLASSLSFCFLNEEESMTSQLLVPAAISFFPHHNGLCPSGTLSSLGCFWSWCFIAVTERQFMDPPRVLTQVPQRSPLAHKTNKGLEPGHILQGR